MRKKLLIEQLTLPRYLPVEVVLLTSIDSLRVVCDSDLVKVLGLSHLENGKV